MYLLMRLLTVVLRAETSRIQKREGAAGAARNRRDLELYMPRFRAFWTLVWEKRYDLLTHEAHDRTYVYAAQPEGGSLRSAVIESLLAMGTCMDSLNE